MRSIARRPFWEPYIADLLAPSDERTAEDQVVTPSRKANYKAAVVLITAALSLTIINYGATAQPYWLVDLLAYLGLSGWEDWVRQTFLLSEHWQRNGLMFWGIGQVLGYTALPFLAIKLVFKERVRDYGLRFRGIGGHAPVYAVLLAISIPAVVAASYSDSFQAKYPFYDLTPGEGLWPTMALWWVVYGLQFVALEFFFRGFMIQGLSGRLGYMAVFVMVVPYNMLHYGKPMAEALAAIVGGVVLGSLSLRSRSIWWGVVVHVGVAGTMDVAALIHKGFIT